MESVKRRGSVHLPKNDNPMPRTVNRDGGLVHRPTMDRTNDTPFTWKAQIPITAQHARIQMNMWTGDFMTLGDADNFDMRTAIVNECNTVALGSALMGTVMIANMVLMPGYDVFDYIVAEGWYENMAWFFIRSWQPIHLVCVTMQIMAMVYCIFVLIALGELTGDAEVRAFAMRIGVKLSGGFVMFFVSLVMYAVWMVLFGVVHNEYSVEALLYCLIPFLITALGIAYFIFLPVLMELYNVKFESNVSQPLIMGRAELRSALDLFERSIGDARKISPQNFEMFIMEQRCEQIQKALVLWCSKQEVLPTAETLLGRWKVEDHGLWINKFEELNTETKQLFAAILDSINGRKPVKDQPTMAVTAPKDKQLASRLRECKILSLGVASISWMTSKLIEEEVELLFVRIHGEASDEIDSEGASDNTRMRQIQPAPVLPPAVPASERALNTGFQDGGGPVRSESATSYCQ